MGESVEVGRSHTATSACASTDLSTQLARLDTLIAERTVDPAQASVWAASKGIKAVPERRGESLARYGIGDRQARRVARRVDSLVAAPDGSSRAERRAEPVSIDVATALVSAEIELSQFPQAVAAERTLQILIRRDKGLKMTRSRPAVERGVIEVANRLQPSVALRLMRVRADSTVSLAYPYLHVPASLPARLCQHVPEGELGRRRRPSESWLASLADEVHHAYHSRTADAQDLASVALWGFSRRSGEMVEAETKCMRVLASMARERGRPSAFWFAERVRFLVGDADPLGIYAAHDAAITLRNVGFVTSANRLLDDTRQRVRRGDFAQSETALMDSLLLSQATFNAKQGYARRPSTSSHQYARECVDRLIDAAAASGQPDWVAAASRARFGLDLTEAFVTSKQERRRFSLSNAARESLSVADERMSTSGEPIWTSQWQLVKMRVGTLTRDRSRFEAAAQYFTDVCQSHPWIPRDHLSDVAEFNRHMESAKSIWPKLETSQRI